MAETLKAKINCVNKRKQFADKITSLPNDSHRSVKYIENLCQEILSSKAKLEVKGPCSYVNITPLCNIILESRKKIIVNSNTLDEREKLLLGDSIRDFTAEPICKGYCNKNEAYEVYALFYELLSIL